MEKYEDALGRIKKNIDDAQKYIRGNTEYPFIAGYLAATLDRIGIMIDNVNPKDRVDQDTCNHVWDKENFNKCKICGFYAAK